MHLTLSPMRGLPGQPETTLSVSGDVITVDGTIYDLSPVPEGGEAVDEDAGTPLTGPITRQGGLIHCAVRVTLGAGADPNQPADPAHWVIPDASGTVTIPALRKPLEPEADA